MHFCSIILREWKFNLKTVLWIFSILTIALISPMSAEARDYHIRASDGELYTVTFGEELNARNFSVQKADGEILRGVTEAERAITTELYFASKLLDIIRTYYSPDTPPYGGEQWIRELSADSLKKLKWKQGATYISGKFVTTIEIIATGGFSLPIAIISEINGKIANELEKRLLLDATLLAQLYARIASAEENVLRNLWLSYETTSTIIEIDEINSAWETFYKMSRYMRLTSDLMNRYLLVPDAEERLTTFIRSIVPVAQHIETLNSIVYSDKHLQQLKNLYENSHTVIHLETLAEINKGKRNFRTELDQAGFFQPVKIHQIRNIRIFKDDFPQRLDVRDYFSPSDTNNLTYIARSNDLSVAVAHAERSGSSVIIIRPKDVGTASVTVQLINIRGLSANQSFSVRVEDRTQQNQKPEPIGTISPKTLRVGGPSKTVNVAPYFSSQNNLTYAVSSNPRGIVSESISGSRVTITPSQAGSASVVVTAFDSNNRSLSAIQTIPVTVQPDRAPIVRPPSDPPFTPPRTTNPAVEGLSEGVSVIVYDTIHIGLNIRRNPWVANNNKIGKVFDGSTGTITDGPQRNGDWTWWKIDWDIENKEGWSVEADGGSQLLFPRPPDLEVRAFDVSDDEVRPGESFRVEATVRNNGPGESPETEIFFYYQKSDEDTPRVAGNGKGRVSSLREDRSRKVWLSVEAPMAPGDYEYGAILPPDIPNTYDKALVDLLDPTKEIRLNNIADERVEVTGSPDLIVESISANKSTVDPGESFRLEATVRNQGIGKPTRNATLRYYRSSNANISDNDTEVGDDSVSKNNLDTNGTEREWIDLTAPTQPGVYYYGTCVDLRYERDTDNNCSAAVAITVRETGPPDLTVSIPTLSANILAPRESVTLTATVRNQGVGPASATTVRAYRSPNINISDVDTEVGDVSIGSLPPGGTQTVQIRVEVPLAAGMYYYGVCVEQAANERNTVNNCSTGAAFTVENLAPVRSGKVPPKKLFVDSDAVIVDLPQYFSDPNNDVPTYTVQSSAVGIVDLALLGSPISYLRIQPLAVGNTAVTVTASDGELTASQTFSVSVVAAPTENEAPVAVGVIPPQSLTIDGKSSTVDISVYFSDANGDTLTYAAWPDNKNVVRLQRTGAFLTIIPKTAGRATVTVRATDPEGLQAFQRISVFVNTTEDTELPAETWMPDANLRAAVRGALGLGPNDSLTQQAIENLTSLRYLGPDLRDNQKITDLTGLEHAVNLEHLDLYAHFIRDLRPLVRLGKLRSLWLAGNRIANIRPLTSLPLEQVDLGGNPITDFAPLSELTSLTRLDFWGNRLGDDDLSTIKGLTQLTELDLRNNQISDVTPLTQLVNLKKLRIKGNPISDMSPLLTLTDLEIDTEISDKPPSEPDMGITPEVPDLIVASISVGKTEIYPGAVFRMDVVIRNQGKAPSGDATVRFYRSMDETITTADTQVNRSNLRSIAVDATRNKWARLPTPNTAGVYYYGVCIEGVADESDTENNCSTAVKITVGTVPAKPPVVERPTPVSPEIGETPPQADSLAKQVFEKHGKTLGRQDVKEVLPNVLTTLKEPDIQALLTPATINLVIEDPDLLKTMVPTISDKFITLLKTDAEIKTLLSDPQVQTLLQTPAAIDELAKLLGISVAPPPPTSEEVVFPDAILAQAVRKTLKLPAGAAIPKAKLATLTQLEVPFDSPETERIKDLTGLEQAKQLTTFKIYHSVPDVTPLAGLTKLETVALFSASSEDRSITDLSPFKKLTNLRRLFLENVNSDFTPLTGLTKLEELSLFAARIDDNNLISLIPILAGMKNLRKLNLGFNSIQDATPLAALANLESLVLWENPVTDASLRQLKLQNPGLDILGVDIPAAPSNNASVTVLPDETALLPNYPNPFNPETWIPYELATDTDVRITIYNAQGVVVRSLSLGHQSAGYYTGRERAAYWDGRNAFGEQVASGIYFYEFKTDTMSAMRKMVILK